MERRFGRTTIIYRNSIAECGHSTLMRIEPEIAKILACVL
jgi:hypothetical protein